LTKIGRNWGVIFTNYDALAAFNTEAMASIGGWDEKLPWYLSDCDIYRRMRLAGYSTLQSTFQVKHTPSQTLNSDPEIKRKVEEQTAGWQAYYENKWGGPNEHETFLTPFNQ
jgi:GT2 family glycosyltransferase